MNEEDSSSMDAVLTLRSGQSLVCWRLTVKDRIVTRQPPIRHPRRRMLSPIFWSEKVQVVELHKKEQVWLLPQNPSYGITEQEVTRTLPRTLNKSSVEKQKQQSRNTQYCTKITYYTQRFMRRLLPLSSPRSFLVPLHPAATVRKTRSLDPDLKQTNSNHEQLFCCTSHYSRKLLFPAM